MADSAPNCFDHVDPPVISAVEQCETTTDTPLTGALVRCSSYADEPLPGTAPFVAHGWILIEHTGAWSHDIFDGETVLPEVSAALKDYAATYGMRIAFIAGTDVRDTATSSNDVSTFPFPSTASPNCGREALSICGIFCGGTPCHRLSMGVLAVPLFPSCVHMASETGVAPLMDAPWPMPSINIAGTAGERSRRSGKFLISLGIASPRHS